MPLIEIGLVTDEVGHTKLKTGENYQIDCAVDAILDLEDMSSGLAIERARFGLEVGRTTHPQDTSPPRTPGQSEKL